MKLVRFVALGLILILAGCGKRLEGRYEAVPEIPTFAMPGGVDPKLQQQLDNIRRTAQESNKVFLEFNGSKVKMGSASAIVEYTYRVDGQILEVTAEGMGMKAIIPMTIHPDGSISYMSLNYKRVR
jgi:hypothetical protein